MMIFWQTQILVYERVLIRSLALCTVYNTEITINIKGDISAKFETNVQAMFILWSKTSTKLMKSYNVALTTVWK